MAGPNMRYQRSDDHGATFTPIGGSPDALEIGSTLEEHDARLLVAIDAALQRIEAGTYGKCVNCGAQIPEERLEAMPWATLCIDCKRKEERG